MSKFPPPWLIMTRKRVAFHIKSHGIVGRTGISPDASNTVGESLTRLRWVTTRYGAITNKQKTKVDYFTLKAIYVTPAKGRSKQNWGKEEAIPNFFLNHHLKHLGERARLPHAVVRFSDYNLEHLTRRCIPSQFSQH